MKKTSLLTVCYLLIIMWSATAMAAITTAPSSVTVSRGTQSVQVIQYNFDVAVQDPTSPEGVFLSGTNVLGRVNTTVSATLRLKPGFTAGAWIGSTSERLVISETVLKRAEKLGVSRFQYRRQFFSSFGLILGTTNVQVVVTTTGGGPLQISGIRLYFDNNQGNITVKRNDTGLRTNADIDYYGTGYFRAYWQVDGRILAYINRYLNTGSMITFKTLEIPGLPTFREGSHTVRLIIQEPDQQIPFPKAIYYVTADKVPSLAPINLAEPGRQAVQEYKPFRVAWSPAPGVSTYLVEFFLKDEDLPVFSAYVAGAAEYILPEPALRHYFVPGKDYVWRVKGFDGENNLSGESADREFRLH